MILLVLQGLLPLISLYLIKQIIDSIVPGGDFSRTLFYIVLACAAALLAAFCRAAAGVASEAQAALVSDHIQDLLHEQSVQMDLEYYENASYYDSLHRAQREAPFRPARIVNGLAQLGQGSVSLLAVVALLISFNWVLAAVLMLAAVPGIFVRLKYADRLYKWQQSATSGERKALYLHWLLTSDSHAKEIRVFSLGKLLMDRYRELRNRLRDERLNIAQQRSLADFLAQVTAAVALFASLAAIAHQAYLEAITLGALVMYFGAFQQGQSYMQSSLAALAALYEDNLFLTDLYDFLDLQPKVKEPVHPRQFPHPISGAVVLENLSFSYPGIDREVLSGLSMTIKPGQTVALVGENGCGKTTLIKLLCRLYDPTSGRITVDGIDLRDFRIRDLRGEIGVIFQDFARYNLTARENIWFGSPGEPAQHSSIVLSAQTSGADEFIRDLQHGYDTLLGRWFEEGAELSVGQWQKLALARAFFRNSQLIVLDEPTSALDPRAEDDVVQSLQKLAEGRTAVLISHRLSTVKMADCIFFLKDGRLAESGSHEELMARGQEYARLFEIQARHYR